MLQVTDTGATITLTGKSVGGGDGMFWFASALLIGAVAVAMAMSLLPMRLAIGALALLIVGSFVFNWLRMRQKKSNSAHITGGILKVQPNMFVHNLLGKSEQVHIQPQDKISVKGTSLTVTNSDGTLKCQILGFESTKEAQVMEAVLRGQQFGKRNANIKMQSN